MPESQIMIIAGPTASGKSGLASMVARRLNGVIINADSMQVYRDLQVLSARPSTTEMTEVPHRLYGVVDGGERCSAGHWLELAASAINEVHQAGSLPVITGGSGLYINALINGITAIPPVDPEMERLALLQYEQVGPDEFYEMLTAADKLAAENVEKKNKSRLVRAWVVYKSTGKSLYEWQRTQQNRPFPAAAFKVFILEPERNWLYQRCDERFAKMLESGAIEEVGQLLERNLSPSLPVMKALGVGEIAGYIRGEISLMEATEKARQSTRNYAKRQLTWFRHQLSGTRFDPSVAAAQQMGDAIIAGLS